MKKRFKKVKKGFKKGKEGKGKGREGREGREGCVCVVEGADTDGRTDGDTEMMDSVLKTG